MSNLAWALELETDLWSEIPENPRVFKEKRGEEKGVLEDGFGIGAEHHEKLEYEEDAMELPNAPKKTKISC